MLITAAHTGNFRRDLDGVIIPVDLVIALGPSGVSALLPASAGPWQHAEE